MLENFDKLTNSLKSIKNQYFPYNQVEKDVYELLYSKTIIFNPIILQQIDNYTIDNEKSKILEEIIFQKLELKQQYSILNLLLNLIEYIIINSNKYFVNRFNNLTLKSKLTEINKFYMCLENGIDKGTLIHRKTENLLWLLNNEEQLYDERKKKLNIKNKYDEYDEMNNKIDNEQNDSKPVFKKIIIKPLIKKESISLETNLLDLDDFSN